MKKEMISVSEAAEKLGISVERVRVLCRDGRVKGAQMVGKVWVLPAQPQVVAAGRQRPGKVKLVPARKAKAKQ